MILLSIILCDYKNRIIQNLQTKHFHVITISYRKRKTSEYKYICQNFGQYSFYKTRALDPMLMVQGEDTHRMKILKLQS